MCGIAGAVWRLSRDGGAPSPPPDLQATVAAMCRAQGHRGPDGSGTWEAADRSVVFGHRRLAILDLTEAGAQPMVDRASGCSVTFNGEVYNFQDIRTELEALGHAFQSACDTEVLLKAYVQWGLDAVARFRGIFAFALWDPRARSVHLVRDQMGVKPLYWTLARAAGEEVLLFASEVRGLLASPLVARRLDPAAIASYLWHGFVVGPQTIAEGIHLLPPATVLTLAPGEGRASHTRRERRYWRMPASGDGEATVDDVRHEIRKVVSMQLVADVPLGVFLSGGVDSSAVAALASEAVPVHTFTIGFDEAAYDETRPAQEVAAGIRSRHTRSLLTEAEFQDQLPEAFEAVDQPSVDGINTFFVSRAARRAGMTVALAGTGGDEVFGGYPSFVEVPRMLRAGAWLPFAAGDAVGRGVDQSVGMVARVANDVWWNRLGVAPPQTRWGKLADVTRTARDALGLYQTFYALFTRESQAVLAGDVVRRAQHAQQFGLPAAVAADWRGRIQGNDLLHAVSLLELSSFIGERLLRDTDAASMAVALEVRVPLLDHVLLEVVARVPPARRFYPLGRKQLLRDVALGGLDARIFDRRKSGFVIPIDTWARRRLQPRMEALFGDVEAARRAGLRAEALRTLWHSFREGRRGIHWTRIWALYVLLSWCRRHEMAVAA